MENCRAYPRHGAPGGDLTIQFQRPLSPSRFRASFVGPNGKELDPAPEVVRRRQGYEWHVPIPDTLAKLGVVVLVLADRRDTLYAAIYPPRWTPPVAPVEARPKASSPTWIEDAWPDPEPYDPWEVDVNENCFPDSFETPQCAFFHRTELQAIDSLNVIRTNWTLLAYPPEGVASDRICVVFAPSVDAGRVQVRLYDNHRRLLRVLPLKPCYAGNAEAYLKVAGPRRKCRLEIVLGKERLTRGILVGKP